MLPEVDGWHQFSESRVRQQEAGYSDGTVQQDHPDRQAHDYIASRCLIALRASFNTILIDDNADRDVWGYMSPIGDGCFKQKVFILNRYVSLAGEEH